MNFLELIYNPFLTIINSFESKISEANIGDSDIYDDIQDAISSYKSEYSDKVTKHLLIELEKPSSRINLLNAGVEPQNFEKGILLAALISTIEEDANFNPEDLCAINPALFQLLKHDHEELPFKAYGYQNIVNVEYSIGYLNLTEAWRVELAQSGLNHHLLAIFINKLQSSNHYPTTKKFLLIRAGAKNKPKNSAFLKLHAIVEGRPVHQPYLSQAIASHYGKSLISPNENYQQFNEILIILSEYVNQKEVLFKYLGLYQVLENFMFRIPIAQLANKSNPGMFSIRQFKSLYSSLKEPELKTFTNRFSQYWTHSCDGATLSNHANQALTNLRNHADFNEGEFNKLLPRLDLNLTYAGLNGTLNQQNYGHLVYKLRCVIVHNNETEFHLSSFNMNNSIRLIIDKLFIEVLEKLIFDLVIKKQTSFIWYDSPNLTLYKSR